MAKLSSSGHKLGQIVGDWYEEFVAARILESVANDLSLYVDHRFKSRTCRSGSKVIWSDLDGNSVDYDFVLELGGTDTKRGTPIAFFETFWRRGTRHSKDKARDDSGKLLPMRSTYPTARILGIISAGDFSVPAQDLVKSRSIDLFYIPKNKIIESWRSCGVEIDYDDGANEVVKSAVAASAVTSTSKAGVKKGIADMLYQLVGEAVFKSYSERIKAAMYALPVTYGISNMYVENKKEFENYSSASDYLSTISNQPNKDTEMMEHILKYEVLYSDGFLFQRDELTAADAILLHETVGGVFSHFEKIVMSI
jgi:hypothetical protein